MSLKLILKGQSIHPPYLSAHVRNSRQETGMSSAILAIFYHVVRRGSLKVFFSSFLWLFKLIIRWMFRKDDHRNSPDSLSVSKQPKSWYRCSVCGTTSRKTPDRKFFRFPKDPIRSKQWAPACSNQDLLNIITN
ncbi:uncharacterized protein LOC118205302 [Stegodyphus dumicola]|uniref:uncharacterized protein LOC118205302 n=1 Tax=Stegodyphus dumicola TaxID=202533 RepID=UPI0015B1097B|nr:uncharacterized protein LOC118205302 [Stegodyphus dumicola]